MVVDGRQSTLQLYVYVYVGGDFYHGIVNHCSDDFVNLLVTVVNIVCAVSYPCLE